MNYVYVLTSSPKDIFYEQFLLSATSLKLVMPDANITLLCDSLTKDNLVNNRTEYQKLVNNVIVINAPSSLNQMEVSRWLKTSLRKHVRGDFLYIDSDTIIAEDLSVIGDLNINFGVCLDKHLLIDKHPKKNEIIKNEKLLGFNSHLTNKHFNAGILYCKDTKESYDIFSRWHELWLYCRSKGILLDQPSFNMAVSENQSYVSELSGIWNCQISHNGLKYLADSKIIHYFSSDVIIKSSPYLFSSDDIHLKTKKSGVISEDLLELLKKPRSAFFSETRIVANYDILYVLNSNLFKSIFMLWKKLPRIFNLFENFSLFYKNIYKNKFLTESDLSSSNNKTITVDCRLIDSSGVGSFLRGILPYLLKSNYDILLLGNKNIINRYITNTSANIIYCNIPPFTIKDIFFFPKKYLKIINKTDYYFSPFFNIPSGIKIPVFLTIHDIVFPDMKKISSFFGLLLRMYCYRRAYKKARKIFTVSEFSKSRIEHHLGNKTPVVVINGSSVSEKILEYRKHSNTICKKEHIVFVGNIKKHKGLNILVNAFLQAKQEGLPHKLIIIGNMNKLRTTDNKVLKKIKSLNSDYIRLTGLISDDELIEIISSAALLVHPSLYEGFGLPPLEALMLGTNVLISDIPTFKEIYKDFPVTFFKKGDSNDLKDKLMELLLNKTPSTVDLSDELVTKYTFEKTVSKMLTELQ